MGAAMGARARGRQERRAAREAREAQEVQEGGGARDALGDELVWYRCPYSYCKMEGYYRQSTIASHEAVHVKEEAKAREAREQREADRQREDAARGKTPGKGARRWAARDKRFGK